MNTIPCPCCHRTGEYHDKYGTDNMEVCTACHGSGVMEVSEKNLDRINRVDRGEDIPHITPMVIYSGREVEIMSDTTMSPKKIMEQLGAEGFKRTYSGVAAWRHKRGIKMKCKGDAHRLDKS